jgi:hypothetical protein
VEGQTDEAGGPLVRKGADAAATELRLLTVREMWSVVRGQSSPGDFPEDGLGKEFNSSDRRWRCWRN